MIWEYLGDDLGVRFRNCILKRWFLLRKTMISSKFQVIFGGLHKIFRHTLEGLPETNSSPLKVMVSNRNLLFQGSIFRGYVSFREGKLYMKPATSYAPEVQHHLATFVNLQPGDGLREYSVPFARVEENVSVKYTICKWSNVYVRILSHNKLI